MVKTCEKWVEERLYINFEQCSSLVGVPYQKTECNEEAFLQRTKWVGKHAEVTII